MKFKTAGIVFPDENKTVSGKFSFNDKLKGVNKSKTLYYRIKQVNTNGTSVCSSINRVGLKENENNTINSFMAYKTVHMYTYCAEIKRGKTEINNNVARILRNTFVIVNKNFI